MRRRIISRSAVCIGAALALALTFKPPLVDRAFAQDKGAVKAANGLVTATASVPKPSVKAPVEYQDKIYSKKKYKLNKKLVKASAKGNVEKVEKLLDEGADIEFIDDTSFFTHAAHWNPLQYACKHGNIEIMDFLISGGAGLGPNKKIGSTPLMVAAYYNQSDAVEFLIAKGAKVDERSDNEFTALMSASINGRLDAGRKLVQHGADVNAKSSFYGDTPLYLTVARDNYEFVEFLLFHGADINVRNNYDMTPLIKAAGNGSVNSVKILVAKGADVNLLDDEGMNALMWAVRGVDAEVKKLPPEELEKMGVGERSLYEMKRRYRKESIEIIKILLANPNLDIGAVDNEGRTVLDYADDAEVRKLLEKQGGLK